MIEKKLIIQDLALFPTAGEEGVVIVWPYLAVNSPGVTRQLV